MVGILDSTTQPVFLFVKLGGLVTGAEEVPCSTEPIPIYGDSGAGGRAHGLGPGSNLSLCPLRFDEIAAVTTV